MPTKVYSRTGAFLGVLENAKTGYTLKDVPVSSAKIELPLNDGGHGLCKSYNRVEIFDGERRVELFRIIGMPKGTLRATGGSCTYKAEHVIATLMDKIMPGYHEIGGTGVGMADCIRYILGFQNPVLWQLGTCDFTTQFQYSFTNAYLLNALLALPKQLEEAYQWTFDTTTTPWTLNLVRPSSSVGCEILYRHNMAEITKTYDDTGLCTRCYPFGYGEGMNQLTIRDVNNGRLYLDADTQDEWGVVEKPFVDTTMERADALKRRAAQWMNACKNPRITYTAKAVDLSRMTGDPMDTFLPGKLCRVNDQEHGVLVTVRVAQVSKDDPAGKPENVNITLSNSTETIANTIADLAARASVNELTAQGATNIAPIYVWNNADKDHPVEIPYDIVAEYVRINKFSLIVHIGSFRSYSLGAAAGGGSVSTTGGGGGGTRTSSAGGDAVITKTIANTSSHITTDMAASSYTSSEELTASGAGGGYTQVSGDTGHSHACYSRGSHYHDISTGTSTDYAGTHDHSIGDASCSHSHYVYPHTHDVAAHRHSYGHVHEAEVPIRIPSFTINLSSHVHQVDTPEHSHSLELDDHTHADKPGIYDHGSVEAVTITVDGTTVPRSAIVDGRANLIPYLAKDDAGKVVRGEHTIVITPVHTASNPDGLCSIGALLSAVVFVRSQGGGDY